MSIATFQCTVENGQTRRAANVNLPDKTTVSVIGRDMAQHMRDTGFVLAEMIARMPAGYQSQEESFGEPVGRRNGRWWLTLPTNVIFHTVLTK